MPSPDLILDFARAKQLDPRIAFARNSIGSHFMRDGLLKFAAINVPRFEHDPASGRCLGLLVEESRTNQVPYSDQFDNPAWTKSSTGTGTAPVVTPNDGIAPDGTMTADKIVFDKGAGTTNSDQSVIYRAIASVVGQPLAHTVWLRTTDGTTKAMRFDFNGVSANTMGTSSLITVTPSYKRFFIAHASPNNTLYNWRLGLRGQYSTDDYASVHAWGAGRENAVYKTSYVPTSSSAATREADTASMSLGPWWSALGGTLLCSFQAPIGITVGTHTLYDLHDGSANNRILLQTIDGALQAIVTTEGVEQCNLALGTLTALADYNVAFAFRANDFSASLNAGVCVTDTAGTIPTVTTLALGHDHTPANWLNGSLGRVLYFAARLPDASLRELSR